MCDSKASERGLVGFTWTVIYIYLSVLGVYTQELIRFARRCAAHKCLLSVDCMGTDPPRNGMLGLRPTSGVVDKG